MEIRLLIWALCCALLLWILRVSVGLDPPPRVPGAQESRQPVPVREIYCKEYVYHKIVRLYSFLVLQCVSGPTLALRFPKA